MFFNKLLFIAAGVIVITSCSDSSAERKQEIVGSTDSLGESINKSKKISKLEERKDIYNKLIALAKGKVDPTKLPDSVTFLIIPIDAACNGCRDKATGETMIHRDFLRKGQFIIFSATGMKPIRAYFEEQGKVMPEENKQIFFDSDNSAFMSDLIFTHPTVFNCYKGEAYEKIVSFPLTINDDLKKFFKS